MVLSVPWVVDPTVLPGKTPRLFHKRMLALPAGKYEIRDDWLEQSVCQERYLLFCFALTRFDLYRTKSFSSPWMKASLLIPVNANVPHRPLCQKWLCHDVWMFYFCWAIGQIKTVEHSSFTCRFLVQLPQNSGSEIQVLDQACLVCIAQCPKAPGTGLCLAGEWCRAQLHWGRGSCTEKGSQSDDTKQNLGRGKEASSFLDISSAKSVPGLMFVNFLVSWSTIDMAEEQDNEKHDNAAFLFYIWHGLRFLAKAFADQKVQSTPARC